MFMDFYEYAQDKQIPIMFHAGDPDTPENGRILYHETYNILKTFPKLKMTLAHFTNVYKDRKFICQMLDEFENLTYDLATGGDFMITFSRDLPYWTGFLKHYQDRIIYGTDSYIHEIDEATAPGDIDIGAAARDVDAAAVPTEGRTVNFQVAAFEHDRRAEVDKVAALDVDFFRIAVFGADTRRLGDVVFPGKEGFVHLDGARRLSDVEAAAALFLAFGIL